MTTAQSLDELARDEILYLPLAAIDPDPEQPRRIVLAKVHRYDALAKRAGALMPPGQTAESIVRSLALHALAGDLSHIWNDGKEFRAAVKPLGLDVDALLNGKTPAPAKPTKRAPDPAAREKPITIEPALEEAAVL